MNDGAPARLDPGAVIGILGDGQLGRMIALAAFRLGYRCHVFGQDADAPAAQVCGRVTLAPFEDIAALDAFAAAVDVVTLEFENVPVAAAERLATRAIVRPGPKALAIAQDRIREKSFLNGIGLETAPWAAVDSAEALHKAAAEIGLPAILKAARLGYDGKGQVRLDKGTDLARAHAEIGGVEAVLEGLVAFTRELSVIVARAPDGAMRAFDPVENIHRDGILHITRAPAPVAPETARQAVGIAERIAEALDLTGLVAVEMFQAEDGRLLVNEIAPRPHNSGHWTLDAAATSQFEQLVRAICGQPLGPTRRLFYAEMRNLIGAEVESWPNALAEPSARLHLYGKTEARAGRKMGHVTTLSSNSLEETESEAES